MTKLSRSARKRKRRKWKKFYSDPENKFRSCRGAYRRTLRELRAHFYGRYEVSHYHGKQAEEVEIGAWDWRGQALVKDLARKKAKTSELAAALGRVWP